MRPWVLLTPVAAVLVAPAGAAASSPTGGTAYGAAGAPRTPLRVAAFGVNPGHLSPGGATTVSLRITGAVAKARMRVVLVAAGARQPVATLQLGWRPTGVTIVRRWTPTGALAPGDYVARVHAVDRAGRALARSAAAPGKLPVTVDAPPAPAPVLPAGAAAGTPGVFPIRGTFSFGGPDARFGAQRVGHVHHGQDIVAAEGTPVVSPVAGTVFWRAVQPSGAGHYLVVRGGDGCDYVFMHLVAGSETVAKGDPVAAGQVIGAVGQTGDAHGAHLHFELWPHGWYAKGSEPVDPLPQLQAWAAAVR